MSRRIRYIPDEILAIFITTVIGLTAIIVIINVSYIIAWVRLLLFVD